VAPGIVAGGLLARAGVFAVVKGPQLAAFFALFIGFSATQMLLGRQPRPSRQMPALPGQAALGATIGLLSGLVGAGGAFIAAPFMTWCRLPNAPGGVDDGGQFRASRWPWRPRRATWSAAHQYAALPGAFGYLYLPALLVVSAASVLMAPVGARVAHGLDVRSSSAVSRWCCLRSPPTCSTAPPPAADAGVSPARSGCWPASGDSRRGAGLRKAPSQASNSWGCPTTPHAAGSWPRPSTR
jgi:hypothetical protein